MHGELGLVFVEEDFDVAPDDDYWGSNWEVRPDQRRDSRRPAIRQRGRYCKPRPYRPAAGQYDHRHQSAGGIRPEGRAEVAYGYDGGAVDEVDKPTRPITSSSATPGSGAIDPAAL